MSLKSFFIYLAISSFTITSHADGMRSHMESFYKNPKATMAKPPAKKLSTPALFSESEISSKAFVDIKASARRGCSPSSDVDFDEVRKNLLLAEINRANEPSRFLQTNSYIKNIKKMEVSDLMAARLSEIPWSADYWAIANGVLGARNFDNDFLNLGDWLTRFEYTKANNYVEIYRTENTESINVLSPSEKYELVVGDLNGELTKLMWEEGRRYYDEFGKVETWMGICHGWAAAAYMLAKPEHSITVPGFDKQSNVKFYPSEIKGLATHLWANARFPIRFMSQRCTEKEPEIDENGRVIDSKCFDTNPGAWHIAITNHLGIGRKSFILDATFDYEVWNQPVYEYSYSYYNLVTNEETHELSKAVTPIGDYKDDFFKQYRSEKAKYIVGIAMKVAYVVEVGAQASDTALKDQLNFVDYYYDLELDENLDIIGGEWYTRLHPDFIWTPSLNAKAESPYDTYVQTKVWDGVSALPNDWQEAARLSNTRGLLLNTIVSDFIEKSRR